MKWGRWRLLKALPWMVLMCPSATFAAPLSFDCDVPPDHFSSVSEDMNGALGVSGTVKAVQLRSGEKYVPVAAARLVSADDANAVGFQLVADSPRAKQFDVVLNLKRGEAVKRNVLGQVDASGAISFRLTQSAVGKVVLTIGTSSFEADFMPLTGKVMVLCSTGQFKFTNLEFLGS